MMSARAKTQSMDPNPRVDVCVVERNSSRTLEMCLSSIHRHLPYGNLIVVDNQSSDGSASLARKYTDKVYTVAGPVGAVRYKAAELATREWIVFVDSDVYLYRGWWKRVKNVLTDAKVGWVTALCDYPCSLPVYKEYHDFIFRTQGATAFSNTAVRRDLILSCSALLKVHMTEDWVAKKHVMDAGFQALTIKESLSYHDKDHFKGHFRAYYRWGQSYRMRFGVRGALALGYLSFMRYPMVDWLKFTRARRLSLPLLFFLALRDFCGIVGILVGVKASRL